MTTSSALREDDFTEGADQAMATLLKPTIPNPLDNEAIPREYSPLGVITKQAIHEVPARLGQPSAAQDATVLRIEIRNIKAKLKQSQNDLKNEQETVAGLRKKLNSTDRERLDAVSKINEEASRLDSEVTRLRAQLERGEALRQNLELELAKARKDLAVERRDATEKEALMGDVNEAMKSKLNELTSQVEKLCDELETQKAKTQEESSRLRETITNKEKELSSYRYERETFESEKEKAKTSACHKDRLIEDLEEKLQVVEDSKREQSENLRRQIHENDFIREKEERLRKDLENAQERIRVLEENVEAERAAHLESKFNSEIVQLRLRDLEAALDLEKSSKADTETNTEKLNRQIRELQQIYDEERLKGKMAKQQLERAEQQTAEINKRLKSELNEKANLIKQLSQQLDVHTRNFDELKQELAKAKKRQAYLEETYTGSIKELEILLDNFQLVKYDKTGSSSKTASKKPGGTVSNKGTKKKESGKTQTLNSLLEQLRRTLIDYKHKVDDVTSELAQVKGQREHINKEYEQYKDLARQKDKSLESSQQGLTRTSKELRRCQSELREAESTINLLQEQLDKAQTETQQHLQSNQQLRDQVLKVASKCKADEKTSGDFLHSLYQQLRSFHTMEGVEESVVVQNTASLSEVVSEQVSRLISSLTKANSKVKHLESTLSANEAKLAEVQKDHEEQLNMLSAIAEGRTQQWEVQRSEMETHYQQLLEDVQARHKKSQAFADQAWDKARATGLVQQSLEAECVQFQEQLSKCQAEHQSLLAVCALLIGTLYPLHVRASSLAVQRNLLTEHMSHLAGLHSQVKMLAEALAIDSSDPNRSNDLRDVGLSEGLLRFRVGVLGVMAANRLIKFGRESSRMLVLYDTLPGLHSLLMCTGSVHTDDTKYSDVIELVDSNAGATQVLDWLTSNELLASIISSSRELNSSLTKVSKGEKLDSRKLITLARSSLQKLLSRLPSTFPKLSPSHAAGPRGKSSLVWHLENGLSRVVAGTSLHSPYISSHDVGSRLQEQVLEFTQRLHAAEVERRDLRAEVITLSQQQHEWTCNSQTVDQLQQQLTDLQQRLEGSVDKEKFDSVYEGLTSALQREEKAQQLLNEQNEKLHVLGLQLEVEMSQGCQKEQTLTGAVQGLAESKIEMKRYEQRIRQFNRQVAALEDEKSRLSENIMDAENALKTAARDRETVSTFVKGVLKVLDKAKTQLALHTEPVPDLRALLTSELQPPHNTLLSKASTEVLSCKDLVSGFIEVQNLIHVRIQALNGELVSYKRHVGQLKDELNAAVHRHGGDEQQNLLTEDTDHFLGLPSSNNVWQVVGESGGLVEFSPLQEEQNTTYKAPSTSSPVRPSAFKTPQRSSLPSSHKTQQDAFR